jgi:SagB-type dehydrogenase family enzyme
VNERSLTIRLDGPRGLVSHDDGETATIEGEAVEEIRLLASDLRTDLRRPTATAIASIAESRHAAPQPGAGPPFNDTATVDSSTQPVLLGPRARQLNRPFGDVLARRQSERRFEPLELDDLATVLVHGARIRDWHPSDDGYQMTSRAAPSAGARHPYELMIAAHEVATLPTGLWLFDPATCSLIRQANDHAHHEALDAVNAAAMLRTPAPATIFLVAHFKRTLNRYPAGSTLVWRDLGAAASTLHLVASAAGLASCIVGTTGVLTLDESNLVADGIALVLGRRCESANSD